MVRKSKDLFVILAERQHRGKSRNGKDAGTAVREVGGTLGRWMSGAVKTLRPNRATEEQGKTAKTKAATSAGRSARRAPRQVPRGLLMPGWLLVGMISAGIGGGFLVGRYTSHIRFDAPLRQESSATQPREFDRKAPDLTPEQETEILSPQFYVCKIYGPKDKGKALALARALRDHGIEQARIRGFNSKEGSLSNWATLCYAASPDGENATFTALQRLQEVLGFELLNLGGSYLQRAHD